MGTGAPAGLESYRCLRFTLLPPSSNLWPSTGQCGSVKCSVLCHKTDQHFLYSSNFPTWNWFFWEHFLKRLLTFESLPQDDCLPFTPFSLLFFSCGITNSFTPPISFFDVNELINNGTEFIPQLRLSRMLAPFSPQYFIWRGVHS